MRLNSPGQAFWRRKTAGQPSVRGPTGVGKTEIAKTLADELGIKPIRYDMSEYEENTR